MGGSGYLLSKELESGAYIYTVTDAAGCSDTLEVFVPAVDTLNVEYLIVDATAFDAQDGAIILQDISGGTSPFEWFWNTEDITASIENIFPGWYILYLTDANDCFYQYNFEVSALDNLSEFPEEEMPRLFPNPIEAKQSFNLEFPKGKNGNFLIEIVDTKGRLLLRREIELIDNNQIKVDTAQLSAGVYFVKVENGNWNYHVFRLVVFR